MVENSLETPFYQIRWSEAGQLTQIYDKDANQDDLDFMWYLWCGPKSPLFGKEKAATFERYFVEEKDLHKEPKNLYYTLIIYFCIHFSFICKCH